jgi:hypothetical protein
MLGFVIGVITGGAVAYYCRDEINSYLNRQLPTVREQLADGLHSVEECASDALVRVRTNISAKLRNGEQWLRASSQPAGNGAASGARDVR